MNCQGRVGLGCEVWQRNDDKGSPIKYFKYRIPQSIVQLGNCKLFFVSSIVSLVGLWIFFTSFAHRNCSQKRDFYFVRFAALTFKPKVYVHYMNLEELIKNLTKTLSPEIKTKTLIQAEHLAIGKPIISA